MEKNKLLIFTLLFALLGFGGHVYAQSVDDCARSGLNSDEITKCIDAFGNRIKELENAIAPLEKESSDLANKINQIKNTVNKTIVQIDNLTNQLIESEADLEVGKILLFERVRRSYINTKRLEPWLFLVSSTGTSDVFRQYGWYRSVIAQDQSSINTLLKEIGTLAKNKKKLESEKARLALLKSDFQKRSDFLSTEIKKAEDYKAELSKKQKDLVAQKTALFSTSVGDSSTSDDPASRADYDPGFRPAFAAFSFGAPHRKGMSQYGAFGRAKNGQSYEQIIKAYYGDIRLETIDMPGSIATSIGSLPFEENYLLGIAEMPVKWGDEGGLEALKAQAVAARSYALSYTGWRMSNRNITGSICTTEACQVYSSTKASNPGDKWRQAVQETKGKVVVSNKTGEILSTWYASTSGGYDYSYDTLGHTTSGGWDTTCGNQGCWPGDAYEKIAGSPWFYKGWYKTRSSQSCGRSHPWLTEEEFSDIINALIVYKNDPGQMGHLSQIDSGGCWGGTDPEAWSKDRLKEETKRFGGAVTSVSGVSVEYSTGGYTASVNVNTNRGNLSFSGEDFKEVFTLRAPGAIHLKSLLFNIEKK